MSDQDSHAIPLCWMPKTGRLHIRPLSCPALQDPPERRRQLRCEIIGVLGLLELMVGVPFDVAKT
jgi:hypothetical protein